MHFPIADEEAITILKHRDAHFGGSLSVMLDYYLKEGVGVQDEIETEQIEALMGFDFLELSEEDAHEVALAKAAYDRLKEVDDPIADMILSEEEDPPLSTNRAALIQLLQDRAFANPLFPGYGRAPLLAARALGKLGEIEALFDRLLSVEDEVELVEEILSALREAKAKNFLIRMLKVHPREAAMALAAFEEDRDIAEAALALIPQVHDEHTLLYLVLCCEPLRKEERFLRLANDESLPTSVRQEVSRNHVL